MQILLVLTRQTLKRQRNTSHSVGALQQFPLKKKVEVEQLVATGTRVSFLLIISSLNTQSLTMTGLFLAKRMLLVRVNDWF